MIHYLSEMHDFYKFSPTKHIIREQNALLLNRVKPISYPSEEQEEQKEGEPVATENVVPQGVSESASQGYQELKLVEVSKLLPHFLLCLDFGVAEKTMKCL